MIAAFLAFGEPSSAVFPAVLVYRVIAFWLPILPGAAAYIQLRRTVAHWKDEDAAAASAGHVQPRAASAGEDKLLGAT
jgi:hypothetical protein